MRKQCDIFALQMHTGKFPNRRHLYEQVTFLPHRELNKLPSRFDAAQLSSSYRTPNDEEGLECPLDRSGNFSLFAPCKKLRHNFF